VKSNERSIKIITGETLGRTNALELVWTVFSEFEAPEYSGEGIREFQRFIEFDRISSLIKNGEMLMWACLIDDKAVGVIAVSGLRCHINLLFVSKMYHRQGIARDLLSRAVDYYLRNSEHRELTVGASPYGVPAYQKLGFVSTDVEQLVNGLRFVPMIYRFK
jgi:GNAT superfamily N-acetyltransferase